MARKPADALTGELFSMIPNPAPITAGSLDLRKRFASMAADAIANYRGKDSDNSKRYHIAARISELCEVDTSKGLIDAYTSVAREDQNLPAWKIPAFEVATNSRVFTENLVAFHGGRALWGEQVLAADLGDIESQIQALMEQRKAYRAVMRRGR